MMGLLDNTEALLALGGGLLGSRGSFGQGLSQAMPQMLGVLHQQRQEQRQKQQDEQQRAMQAIQMQAAQQQLAEQQRAAQERQKQQEWLQSLPSPQMMAGQSALAGGGGPTQANAARMPAVDPMQQMMFGAVKAGAMPVSELIRSMQKDDTPIVLPEGGTAITRTGRVLAKGAAKEDDFLRHMRAAGIPEGSPQWNSLLMQKAQKDATHAPPTQVSVNTAKPLLNTLAEGLGKNIDTSLANAQAAIPAIQTAQTLKQAVDSGKLIAGPGSTFRVLGLQAGQMLGIGGKDGAEVLQNTRMAIQSMAKAELDAAAQMKGQGQITEAERGIIKRAAAGDIDSLTAPELRLLAEGMEKTARFKIKQHQANVSKLGKMPDAAPLMPFYSVEEPAPYGGVPTAGVRKFNPATGKIE